MKRLVVLGWLALSPLLSGQVTLTGFGTGQFTVDAGTSTVGSFSQTASTLNVTLNDQTGTIAGTFTPVSILGQSAALVLTATVATNPGSNFLIDLYDSSLKTASYSGNWSSFTTGASSSVTLAATSATPGFDYSSVLGLQVLGGGTGSSLVANLDTLATAAIPEPSTYAGILGLCALGLASWRRKRRQS